MEPVRGRAASRCFHLVGIMISRWAEHYDGVVFLVAVVAVLLMAMTGHVPDASLTFVLLVTGVVLFGLPHGALDVSVAQTLLQTKRSWALASFFLIYMLTALAYGLFWWWSPSLGLLSFLCISAVHFSTDWQRRGMLVTRLAYGFTLVTLPAAVHRQEVQTIFAALGDSSSEQIVHLMRFVAIPCGIAGLVAASLQWRTRRRDLLEFAGVVLSGLLLPPLLYFACYFCLLHSPRHLFETAKEQGLTRLRDVALAAAPAVLLTVIAGCVVYPQIASLGHPVALLRLIFIGLAALTIPHMLLAFAYASLADREHRSGRYVPRVQGSSV